MRASLGLCACAAALVAHTALATGPHTQADPSRAYLLARTRSSASLLSIVSPAPTAANAAKKPMIR